MTTFLDQAAQYLKTLWGEALSLWLAGGWAMGAIGVTALVMFAVGVNVYIKLQAKAFRSVPERTWRRWIDHPDERRGLIGELLNWVSSASTVEETSIVFEEVRKTETVPFERDLWVMKICVSAAPLLGLLGTVTGMLDTFGALATGAGGDKTMNAVAEGISEALITTETGLLIAIPGLFFQYQLSRKHQRYKIFLAHLESVCAQTIYRKRNQDTGEAA
jgi:biopolymer transport protein ExbB